jgi:prophage maintenance system killer protein
MQWIELISAHAMHDLALWEHGGAEGLRSPELLESAMMRPQMRRH